MQIKSTAFDISKKIMQLLNKKNTDHGIRAAYVFLMMSKFDSKLTPEEISELVFLCMFIDIGAHNDRELRDIRTFEAPYTLSHSVYGYLFIKFFSPMSYYAPTILYHHLRYDDRGDCHSNQRALAMNMNLADRVAVCTENGESRDEILDRVNENSGTMFKPSDVRIFLKADEKFGIIDHLIDGSYEKLLSEFYSSKPMTEDIFKGLVMMLVLSIDFKSLRTVAHSMRTVQFAMVLGKMFGLNEEELHELYYAALLHDVGKVMVPDSILEKTSLLTSEETDTMRKHVEYSKILASDVFDDKITEIVGRHHERLDGSGYPEHLTAKDLTVQQRVLAVADVASALGEARSYRNKFGRAKLIRLIKSLGKEGKLDPEMCSALVKDDAKLLDMSNEPCEEFTRYKNLKRGYLTCIKKYAHLGNHFYKTNKLFPDFRRLERKKQKANEPKIIIL